MKEETLKMIKIIKEKGYWSKEVHLFANELIDSLGYSKYKKIIDKARSSIELISV